MKGIKLKNSLIYYYGSPSGYIKDGIANMDTLFECEEILAWCKEKRYQPCFIEGIFENLVRKEDVSQFMTEENSLKNVRIWQLKVDSDFSMRFISFDEFEKQFGQPNRESYEVIFDGNLCTNDLNEIYDIFNSNCPRDYNGHALSMSDVVELYDEEKSSFYYVDQFGFKDIDFVSQEPNLEFDMKL